MSVGSGVDLLVLLLRSSCGQAFSLARAPHGEEWVMLHYVQVHFGCLSWHLYTTNTTLTLELGARESAHMLCPFLQTSTAGSYGLGRQSTCEFEHTWAQVASITQKTSWADVFKPSTAKNCRMLLMPKCGCLRAELQTGHGQSKASNADGEPGDYRAELVSASSSPDNTDIW